MTEVTALVSLFTHLATDVTDTLLSFSLLLSKVVVVVAEVVTAVTKLVAIAAVKTAVTALFFNGWWNDALLFDGEWRDGSRETTWAVVASLNLGSFLLSDGCWGDTREIWGGNFFSGWLFSSLG